MKSPLRSFFGACYEAISLTRHFDPCLPRPSLFSVADNQNYGDDVNARYLLHPSQFASLGVEDTEFIEPRSKEYIKSMFQDTGYGVEDDVFEELFSAACNEDGTCGVDKYRHVYNSWLVGS